MHQSDTTDCYSLQSQFKCIFSSSIFNHLSASGNEKQAVQSID